MKECKGPVRARFLIVPGAGMGISAFERWKTQMPEGVALLGVQLPGREDRSDDGAFKCIYHSAKVIADELAATSDDTPMVVFGHSLGALVALEMIRELERRGRRPVRHLLVGDLAPAFSERQCDDIRARLTMPPEEAAEKGYVSAVFLDPEVQARFLQVIREDMQALLAYSPQTEPRITCPITAFGATDSKHVYPEAPLSLWQEHSEKSVEIQGFVGNHFTCVTRPERLLPGILAALQGVVALAGS